MMKQYTQKSKDDYYEGPFATATSSWNRLHRPLSIKAYSQDLSDSMLAESSFSRAKTTQPPPAIKPSSSQRQFPLHFIPSHHGRSSSSHITSLSSTTPYVGSSSTSSSRNSHRSRSSTSLSTVHSVNHPSSLSSHKSSSSLCSSSTMGGNSSLSTNSSRRKSHRSRSSSSLNISHVNANPLGNLQAPRSQSSCSLSTPQVPSSSRSRRSYSSSSLSLSHLNASSLSSHGASISHKSHKPHKSMGSGLAHAQPPAPLTIPPPQRPAPPIPTCSAQRPTPPALTIEPPASEPSWTNRPALAPVPPALYTLCNIPRRPTASNSHRKNLSLTINTSYNTRTSNILSPIPAYSPSPSEYKSSGLLPGPPSRKMSSVAAFKIRPLSMFSPATEGFASLEKQFSCYTPEMASPHVSFPTASTATPTTNQIEAAATPTAASVVASSSQPSPCCDSSNQEFSQYLSDREEFVLEDIDTGVQQWISVSESDSAKLMALASPMTPLEMHLPKPKVGARRTMPSLQEYHGDDEGTCDSGLCLVLPSPGPNSATSNRLSLFIQTELSHLDNDNYGGDDSAMLELSTISIVEKQPQHPCNTEDQSTIVSNPTSPTPSSDTLASVGRSLETDTFTTSTTSTSTTTSSSTCDVSSASSLQVPNPESSTDCLLSACPSDVTVQQQHSNEERDLLQNKLDKDQHHHHRHHHHHHHHHRRNDQEQYKQKQVSKCAHGVVWVGEAKPTYYRMSLLSPVDAIATLTPATNQGVHYKRKPSLLARVYHDFDTEDADDDDDEEKDKEGEDDDNVDDDDVDNENDHEDDDDDDRYFDRHDDTNPKTKQQQHEAYYRSLRTRLVQIR